MSSSLLSSSPYHFLQDIKSQASEAACKSHFYHWLLSRGDDPNHLAVKMVDPWNGDAETGRLMQRNIFILRQSQFRFEGDFWTELDSSSLPQTLQDEAHSFFFLRDLRAVGGDTSRKQARLLVDGWMDRYDRYDSKSWVLPVLGERISAWLGYFDFFCASAERHFQERYFQSLKRQANHLSKHLSRSVSRGLMSTDIFGLDLLKAAKGLIYAGLAFPGRESWILQGFDVVLAELPHQILSDGGHISRNPTQLLECLKLLLDLRCALSRAQLPVPEPLQHALDRGGQALRFFRFADKKCTLAHGTQESDPALMDAVLAQIAGPNRLVRALPETGFERLTLGRSSIVIDVSSVPPAPYDTKSHSAPLSFEMCYGKERIFVNCGGHPNHPDWQYVLRHTAAHTALTLDGRPAHERREQDGKILRAHKPIAVERKEGKDSILLEASHNAYETSLGVLHKRRFYLCDQGLDLRGEDTLTSETLPEQERRIDIRFHLHPRVLVQMIQEGDEALLRLPGSGMGFRFFAVGGKLSLDNSIYFGSGTKPLKTKQLVITAPMRTLTHQIKWALQRE
jgi:uncharacterized heparinase superfamily protein